MDKKHLIFISVISVISIYLIVFRVIPAKEIGYVPINPPNLTVSNYCNVRTGLDTIITNTQTVNEIKYSWYGKQQQKYTIVSIIDTLYMETEKCLSQYDTRNKAIEHAWRLKAIIPIHGEGTVVRLAYNDSLNSYRDLNNNKIPVSHILWVKTRDYLPLTKTEYINKRLVRFVNGDTLIYPDMNVGDMRKLIADACTERIEKHTVRGLIKSIGIDIGSTDFVQIESCIRTTAIEQFREVIEVPCNRKLKPRLRKGGIALTAHEINTDKCHNIDWSQIKYR